jgi:long-chain acyl-CoA synthetase
VVAGNVTKPQLSLDEADYRELVRSTTYIIHTVADLRLDASLDELRKTNVGGTAHMLEFARAAHRDHGIERFSYVSTAYVAGARKGIISEDSLTDEYGFYSNYEISKFEAESLVQEAKKELPVSVFRPGQIVGDSRTGVIRTFNTLYFPLRIYFAMRPVVIPAPVWLRINMVPVDYVADALVKMTLLPDAAGRTFHLVVPYDRLPSVREFVRFIRSWAKDNLGMKLPRPLFLPLTVPLNRVRYRARGVIEHTHKRTIDSLITLLPYFFERRQFARDNIDSLMGEYDFKWREVLPVLLEYALDKGFMHRSDRTVHEQILYRLQSRSMPVHYYDVVDGKTIAHDTKEIRESMLTAVKALRAMGIEKGDRVALVGPNSTRYLILDVAIGIAGAVSVPLYMTSPPAEIDQILKASGAKLLCVSAPAILERLHEMETAIPVVSLRDGNYRAAAHELCSWEEFLSRGDGVTISSAAPVGLGDLATIRYTSGTTGNVKGVCFNHQSLRWMGESTCTMLKAWEAGDNEICYISYLPMNHVVEGILATYSVYYTPAPFHIYFVENMKDLPRTLQKVRPQVFFSIPRFYEKIWELLDKSRIGHAYLTMGEGLRRRIVRSILARSVIKQAGLDRCDRLIVGSATMSDSLLADFQELGIEVHNAYGLTEAPLVTMNKPGANRVETVGEPLPQTEVRIAEDGEIIVRGPQVARGYWEKDVESAFCDGWLYTGDLGYLTEEGSLVINGRKKNIIVTSYGKNTYPEKIESLLKSMPYVEEAMVVGEGFPFCSALIWVPGDEYKPAIISYLEQIIKEINYKLSHPEQLKRWAVLKHNLSVENGELTASLKLKRKEVMQRFSGVITAMYSASRDISVDNVHIDGIDKS